MSFNRNDYSFELNDEQARFLEVASQSEFFDSDFVYLDDSGDDEFEDDGFYHVRRHGVRVAFSYEPNYDMSGYAAENRRRFARVQSFVRRHFGSAR